MADARDLIRDYLDTLGLGSENDWAVQQLIEGRSMDAVQIDLEKRPAFQARFPGYTQMKKDGKAFSVNEWLAYERTGRQFFGAAGVDPQLYDNPRFWSKFITQEVSVAELQQRVQMYEDSVKHNYDQEQARLYGIMVGDQIAWDYFDTAQSEPTLRKKFEAAQAATLAQQTGYGQLDVGQAERVGVSGQSVAGQTQAFGDLAQRQELFKAQDAGEQDISRDTQIAGAFEGNAAALAAIDARAKRRQARFNEGGGFAQGAQGFAGVR